MSYDESRTKLIRALLVEEENMGEMQLQ